MSLEVLFIGISDAFPKAGEETACFLVNRQILVDTGWNVAVNVLSYDVSPTDVDHVLCTHCHIDHLLGLPGLLAANRKRASVRSNAPPLRLYGPRDMAAACEAATAMLQVDRLPPTIPEYEVHCVTPGETVSIGEISVQVDGPSTPLTRAATASTTVPAALASSSPETRLTTRGWQPLPKDTTCSSMTHVRMAMPPPRTCR